MGERFGFCGARKTKKRDRGNEASKQKIWRFHRSIGYLEGNLCSEMVQSQFRFTNRETKRDVKRRRNDSWINYLWFSFIVYQSRWNCFYSISEFKLSAFNLAYCQCDYIGTVYVYVNVNWCKKKTVQIVSASERAIEWASVCNWWHYSLHLIFSVVVFCLLASV